MLNEDALVRLIVEIAEEVIKPPLSIERGQPLLYRITVDNRLEVRVSASHPRRGQSAFQTDLCVFEQVAPNEGAAVVKLPRVVLEFKTGLSTHDLLTYSAKARKHKEIYPYLRYGLIVGRETKVHGKFFIHNESLDFLLAISSLLTDKAALQHAVCGLLQEEIRASRILEEVIFNKRSISLYRTAVVTEDLADQG